MDYFLAAFVAALRAHRLLEPEQLEELTDGLLERFAGAEALAQELVRRDWLTTYQAKQALEGRGKDLVLEPYLLLRPLGRGGMGQVFQARQRYMGREVALKVIRHHSRSDPRSVQRFRREIRAAARLSHPNIVHAYDANEVDGTLFLVMEYVEGVNLAELVGDVGPLTAAQASDYVRQVVPGPPARPRAGPGPSRHQAVEPAAGQQGLGRQDPRPGPGPAGPLLGSPRRGRESAHPDRLPRRHGRLPGAGAGAGPQPGRRPGRPLQPGLHVLSPPGRPAPLPPGQPVPEMVARTRKPSRRPLETLHPDLPPGLARGGPQADGQAPRGPLPDRGRGGGRPGALLQRDRAQGPGRAGQQLVDDLPAHPAWPARRARRTRPTPPSERPRRPRHSSAGARPTSRRVSSTGPSPTSTRPCASTRTTPRPTISAVMPIGRRAECDRALADFDAAIRLDPRHAQAYISRGCAHATRGEHDRAIADYDAAIRLDPGCARAYSNRGLAHFARGEFDRAIADYGEVIRLDPHNAHAYNDRGNAYRARGEHQAGHRRLRRGDPPRPAQRRRLPQPGHRPRSPRQTRPGPRRLRRGDPPRPGPGQGLLQPGQRPPTPGASTTGPSPTSTRRSASTRTTPRPTTAAAAPTGSSARPTAPSPTSTRRWA